MTRRPEWDDVLMELLSGTLDPESPRALSFLKNPEQRQEWQDLRTLEGVMNTDDRLDAETIRGLENSRDLENLAESTLRGQWEPKSQWARRISWALVAASVIAGALLFFPFERSIEPRPFDPLGQKLELLIPQGVVPSYDEFRWSYSGEGGELPEGATFVFKITDPKDFSDVIYGPIELAQDHHRVQIELPAKIRWWVQLVVPGNPDPVASQSMECSLE